MFFAAFEKKWWKSNNGESGSGDSQAPDKSLISNNSGSSEIVQLDSVDTGDLEEIEAAALNTAPADWVKSEDKIEHTNDYVDEGEVDEEEEEEEEEEDEEVFTNDDNFEQVDPHAPPAFNLDDSYEDQDEGPRNKQRLRVSSIKEFFSSEILYRYDILLDRDREAIKGEYRIELTGEQPGVWSISLARDINVSNDKKDGAAVVLKLDSGDFLSIVNGKINSQIALVSRRIKIEGDSKKASLLQNILAPQAD